MASVYMPVTESGSKEWNTAVAAKRALRELAKKYPEARADFEKIYGHPHHEETVDEYQEAQLHRRSDEGAP